MKLEIDETPPSDNQVYRRANYGGMYMTADGKAWKEQVSLLTNKYEPTDKPVKVELHLTFSDKRRRDAHNYIKLTLDALENRFYNDDRQIEELLITKKVAKKAKTIIKCENLTENGAKE
jgi:crossover junction endodeoxyribonuclease RusA